MLSDPTQPPGPRDTTGDMYPRHSPLDDLTLEPAEEGHRGRRGEYSVAGLQHLILRKRDTASSVPFDDSWRAPGMAAKQPGSNSVWLAGRGADPPSHIRPQQP